MKNPNPIQITYFIEFSMEADYCQEEVEEYLYDEGYEVHAGSTMEGPFAVSVRIDDINDIPIAKVEILKLLRNFPKICKSYFEI